MTKCQRKINKQVRFVSVKGERPYHPSWGGGQLVGGSSMTMTTQIWLHKATPLHCALSLRWVSRWVGGGGSSTKTTKRKWLHEADSTNRRARPKNQCFLVDFLCFLSSFSLRLARLASSSRSSYHCVQYLTPVHTTMMATSAAETPNDFRYFSASGRTTALISVEAAGVSKQVWYSKKKKKEAFWIPQKPDLQNGLLVCVAILSLWWTLS